MDWEEKGAFGVIEMISLLAVVVVMWMWMLSNTHGMVHAVIFRLYLKIDFEK